MSAHTNPDAVLLAAHREGASGTRVGVISLWTARDAGGVTDRRFRCSIFVNAIITMSYGDRYLCTITIAMCLSPNSLSPDYAPTGADTGPSEKRSNSLGVAGVARTNRGIPDATYGCPAGVY